MVDLTDSEKCNRKRKECRRRREWKNNLPDLLTCREYIVHKTSSKKRENKAYSHRGSGKGFAGTNWITPFFCFVLWLQTNIKQNYATSPKESSAGQRVIGSTTVPGMAALRFDRKAPLLLDDNRLSGFATGITSTGELLTTATLYLFIKALPMLFTLRNLFGTLHLFANVSVAIW